MGLLMANKSDPSSQSKLEHHRVKSFFPRTNKNRYAHQIAKLECKERLMQKYAGNSHDTGGRPPLARQANGEFFESF